MLKYSYKQVQKVSFIYKQKQKFSNISIFNQKFDKNNNSVTLQQQQQIKIQNQLKNPDNQKLQLDFQQCGEFANLKIIPPIGIDKTPLDLCCVVDVSGSMSADATVQTQKSLETTGLNILDLVKHSLKTITTNLNKNDNLGIVTFDSDSQSIQKQLKLNQSGIEKSDKNINQMQPGSCTNLWDGLHDGMEQIKKESKNRNQAVLLFTDGQPNVIPPKGNLQSLKDYFDSNNTAFQLNTYGFGYNLESKELFQMSQEGQGSYSFIPDSGLLGSVLVNSISNLMCNTALKAEVLIEPLNGAKLVFNEDNQINGFLKSTKTSWGAKIPIGSIQFDQIKDIPLQFDLQNHTMGKPIVHVELNYRPVNEQLSEIETLSQDFNSQEKCSENDFEDIQIQHLRTHTIQTILPQGFNEGGVHNQSTLNFFQKQSILNTVLSNISQSQTYQHGNNQKLQDFYQDFNGQVKEAFSKEEWFHRWGQHYIPSLMSAHILQQCNNFKDPGVQHYGGPLFKDLQKQVEKQFLNLPPPKPSRQQYTVDSRGQRRKYVISMTSYYDPNNPCFAEGCLVKMFDGSQKLVEQIQKGDKIHSGQTIECIIKTNINQGQTFLVNLENNLKITPYHPIINKNTKQWEFPIDQKTPVLQKCNAIYSFLLKERRNSNNNNSIIINGYESATLAHQQTTNKIIEHEYFGTEKVVQNLMNMQGWEQGYIELQENCCEKSKITGLVENIQQQKQILAI